MAKGRAGGRGRGGNNQNYSKSFFEYKESTTNNINHGGDQSMNNSSGGNGSRRSRGNFGGEYSRANHIGPRGSGGNYNQHKDWARNQNYDNSHFERNRFTRDVNEQDDGGQENGFRKFRDPKATPRQGIDPYHYNTFQVSNMDIPKEVPANNNQLLEPVSAVVAQPPPICSKDAVKSKEPKLQTKIKTEKVEPDYPTPEEPNNKKAETVPSPDSSSSSENSSEDEKTQLPANPKTKDKEKAKLVQNIKIKKENTPANDKKKAAKQAPPLPPSPSTEASSSEDSSASSSSEEEEVQKMPQPIKDPDALKPKKERSSEDDVVCLGKPNNFASLIDEDEKSQKQPCIVCSKPGHSAKECHMPCKRCNHSSYECQVVCKNCGENYSQNVRTLPKPPNPFVMFMQFMQFCMSQYYDANSEIKYPFPQFESASAPVLGPTPTVEVTRKDIANSKRDRKRTKSGSKHSRKRGHASVNSDKNCESESDASSRATTSTKKKKRAKSVARDVETPQKAHQPQQQQQQQLPPFGGHFPSSMPFPGTFNMPGYNPMLAFTQMMGYNPATMNFPH